MASNQTNSTNTHRPATRTERLYAIAAAQLLCDLAGADSELSHTVGLAFIHAIECRLVTFLWVKNLAEHADEDTARAAEALRRLSNWMEVER